jgi:NAD(P)-dependent dehydrogenase (short-subunit alcohol dehydrogenase family)
MAGRLDGKVAAITGGASGMGRETALRFLREGAQVVFGDLNEATAADALAAIEKEGFAANAAFLRCDVAQEADVEALVKLATARFGRLDCMFNNAGVGGAFGPITEVLVEEWDYTFAVLTRGVFLGVKHAGRVMEAQGQGGVILNTASIAGMGGGAGPTAYSAAKAAVVNLTRCAAGEFAHARIRVNAIAPGAIRTPLLHSGQAQKMEAMTKAKTPWPRLGEGGDIAGLAAYLASDDAQFITGQTIVIDGGALAVGPDFWGYSPAGAFMRKSGVNRGSTGEAATVRERAQR